MHMNMKMQMTMIEDEDEDGGCKWNFVYCLLSLRLCADASAMTYLHTAHTIALNFEAVGDEHLMLDVKRLDGHCAF